MNPNSTPSNDQATSTSKSLSARKNFFSSWQSRTRKSLKRSTWPDAWSA
jgi:hypothetical protein